MLDYVLHVCLHVCMYVCMYVSFGYIKTRQEKCSQAEEPQPYLTFPMERNMVVNMHQYSSTCSLPVSSICCKRPRHWGLPEISSSWFTVRPLMPCCKEKDVETTYS